MKDIKENIPLLQICFKSNYKCNEEKSIFVFVLLTRKQDKALKEISKSYLQLLLKTPKRHTAI